MKQAHVTIAMAILLLGTGPRLHAADLDDLLDVGTDSARSVALLLDGDAMSQQEFEQELAAALGERRAATRREACAKLLDAYVRAEDIVLQPRDRNAFADAVLEDVKHEELAVLVPKLLRTPENVRFDPSAQARVNFGLRLALVAGGAPFETLKAIHERFAGSGWLDLDWFLPALGRAGGADAMPLVSEYRSDSQIMPLGNHQHIRRVPCAAVLAAAYAGDPDALDTILEWYEQDTVNLPRFAWYVQWAIQEGHKPGYTLLDYVSHRIAQAERLLAFLGAERLPQLIDRANREASIALTGYVVRRMEAARGANLRLFLPLADHPAPLVKQRALLTFLDRGTGELREAASVKLRALLKSPAGTDRFVAAETLGFVEPSRRSAMLEEALARESNPAVRRRMQTLRIGGGW